MSTAESVHSVTMPSTESDAEVVAINKFIQYTHDQHLTYDGNMCHRGIFHSRSALFVVLSDQTNATKEAEVLKKLDNNHRIIRMFGQLKHDGKVFMILEDHIFRFEEYMSTRNFEEALASDVVCQVTKGVIYIHENNISHGNLGPHAIHITQSANTRPRAVIAEFNYASEVAEDEKVAKFGKDIKGLGTLFHLAFFKQAVAIGEVPSFSNVNPSNQENIAMNAITAMTENITMPTATAILKHPLFWSPGRQVRFITDVSDRVEKSGENWLIGLEADKSKAIGDWFNGLPTMLKDDLVLGQRSYNGHSIKDLMRAIRNKRHHYHELPEDVQQIYGSLHEGFCHFWLNSVPKLTIYVYIKMRGCTDLADGDYYDDGGASFSDPKCLALLDPDQKVKKYGWTPRPYTGPQSANAAKKLRSRKNKQKQMRNQMAAGASGSNQ